MVKHKRQAHSCANTSMPRGLTDEFIQRVLQMEGGRKTQYLHEQFLTKFVSSDTDSATLRRSRAIEKWLSTELRNEDTNDRLTQTPEEYNILPRVSFATFVRHCQDHILALLGTETVPVEALIGSFSGGVSTSRKRTDSHPASKYLGKAHVTRRAAEIWDSLVTTTPYEGRYGPYIPELPLWPTEAGGLLKTEIVSGNVMFTVPKKADIDRVACKEPDLNMFMQKGIGNFLRRRLRIAGINLNDQGINRSLARRGSVTKDLATFDLSSASDSVTTELVRLFFPLCWFTLLDAVRCHVTVIDGEEHRNQMFSSMGNGFTFELESMLFFVLTRAICYFTGTPGVVSVYGDDIICSNELHTLLPSVFKYFGFQVNTEKSFVDGDFRESCGGHYYDGIDITPFYLRAPLTRLVDVINIANKVRQWAYMEGTSILRCEAQALWYWLRDLVPSDLRGGADLESNAQLVSPGLTSRYLSQETKSSSTGYGGYLHWLNATMERTQLRDAVLTSSRTDTQQRFRSRRVRTQTVTQLPAVFLAEIADI